MASTARTLPLRACFSLPCLMWSWEQNGNEQESPSDPHLQDGNEWSWMNANTEYRPRMSWSNDQFWRWFGVSAIFPTISLWCTAFQLLRWKSRFWLHPYLKWPFRLLFSWDFHEGITTLIPACIRCHPLRGHETSHCTRTSHKLMNEQ